MKHEEKTMPLQVVCPNPQCRKALLIKEEQAGQSLRCPACKTLLSASAPGSGAKNPSTIHTTASANQGTTEKPPVEPSAEQPTPAPASAPAPKPARGGRKEELPAAIGPYRISRELGRGAFGVVYQGHDTKLKRDVAIKVLKKDALSSAKAVERFLREAQVVAQMHHNHIVPVYALGEHDSCHYIASRFVPGKTLADLIPDEGMEPAQAVRLVLQLLEALAYAHEMNVLHRDVKPANAVVDAKGHLHLMDFGLAGWVGQTEGRATQDGTVMGTPAYMPPEQAKGDIQQVREASDQYSAGVVLYELLTGHLPFEGGPLYVQLHNVIETPPPPPSEFRPGLDPQLESLCLRALAKKPEERFPSCQAFAETLRTWQAGRGSATAVVVVPSVGAGLQDVLPVQVEPVDEEILDVIPVPAEEILDVIPVPAQETLVRVPEPPRRRKARRPPKAESSFAKLGGRRLWLLAVGGAAAGVLLLVLVGLWAAGVFKDTVELDLGDGVKLKMVRIPAKGKTFWMGSPEGEKDRFSYEVQHEVTLSQDFYLGVTEVTQSQYRAVMGTNPSYYCKDGGGKAKVAGLNTDDFPVELVSWADAKAFCRKVGEKRRDGQEYRLPTEAEWEYACRGGASAKDSVPFYLKSGPTTSLSGGQINFDGNSPYGGGSKGNYLERTARCGSFAEAVNVFGLCDMHGNVLEWCEDWYGEYPKGKTVDPRGPSEGSKRVFRGGSWSYPGQSCRAALRYWDAPSSRYTNLGFRLARVSVP